MVGRKSGHGKVDEHDQRRFKISRSSIMIPVKRNSLFGWNDVSDFRFLEDFDIGSIFLFGFGV
jgi:hypothetical protein